ncbi:MAG: DAK2 domain-containing protein [Clostridiales bacterium]|nr:DAK2 domain-containing protein [Clostridiales bacterium]
MSNILENAQLVAMFKGAHQNLMLNQELVDSLNVFPVPDGDTGTNMGLTMSATVKEMETNPSETIAETMKTLAKGALKGARGNSGVILSQIIKGMSEVLENAKLYNTKNFAKALNNGSIKAYDAVTHPKEGTILTVIRIMSEYAVRIASRTTDFINFFEKIIAKGNEVLKDTPNMLPILKKAGVVDSGGQGLMFIIIGMYNTLAGIEMKPVQEDKKPKSVETVVFETDVHDLEHIKYTYCTEFFVLNIKKQATLADIDKFRDQLMEIGDCVLVIGDLDLVKVHVHTNNPDKALAFALKLGELDMPKIENMREQHRKLVEKESNKEKKETALVAICSGDGFIALFKELNASNVLEGGQTMNPSVDDIVKLVHNANAKNVFILPNNKNIVLACEQAKELVDCNLVTIATVNVPQGIAAAMNFDSENKDLEMLKDAMESAAKSISCIEVTHAVRDTEIDGFELHNGDIIAIEKGIISKGQDLNQVVIEALATKNAMDMCVITLYYGKDVTEEQGEELQAKLIDIYPDCDVNLLCGGQMHYYYFISVE